MNHRHYKEAINNALNHACPGPEWNAIFEVMLLRQGLKIVSDKPPKHPLGNDYMAPVPVDGERHTYPWPSWIVESEKCTIDEIYRMSTSLYYELADDDMFRRGHPGVMGPSAEKKEDTRIGVIEGAIRTLTEILNKLHTISPDQ